MMGFATALLVLLCVLTDSSTSSGDDQSVPFDNFDMCRIEESTEEVFWRCWNSGVEQNVTHFMLINDERSRSYFWNVYHNCSAFEDVLIGVTNDSLLALWCDQLMEGAMATQSQEEQQDNTLLKYMVWRYYSRYFDYCFWTRSDDVSAETGGNQLSYDMNCWLEESPDRFVHFKHANTIVSSHLLQSTFSEFSRCQLKSKKT